MMKTREKSYPSVQFGTSLMLVVFMILSLTAFAVLSLSGAMRDYEYSKKSAARTSDYYRADAEANRMLSEIAAILKDVSKSYLSLADKADGRESYIEQAYTRLEEMPELNELSPADAKDAQVTYRVSINQSQALQVTLALYTPQAPGDRLYRIVQWKEISTQDWKNTTTLPVIGSD